MRPTPEQLAQAIRFACFEELEGQEERDGWREVLSTAQVERIVEVNRTAMERFGYLPLER